jgi:hypothetical protein
MGHVLTPTATNQCKKSTYGHEHNWQTQHGTCFHITNVEINTRELCTDMKTVGRHNMGHILTPTATKSLYVKDRVTQLACANGSETHRLPLMLISKNQKPQCFKHMDMIRLPVHSYAQRKSWMDSKLFTGWFHEQFVPCVIKFCRDSGTEEKVLLLVDNAPSHPSSSALCTEDGKTKTLFLSPNTTSVIQPMDRGVLEPMKKRYKCKLLSWRMSHLNCLSQISSRRSP